ncbi:MAG: 4-hydroxy-tetrahydrodipicolinate reductase [Propionibacteriaceae bacterium]|nr:4-hydroxy-tetrahydrodipicolinate reductase [Micropruina sp.]HBX82564.1 4-hydroxy-tetrahydrodipicolinate reductase [Propionibacteriaceae bacterium]HBY24560.1 4-hydroxy-tetrahydrodipicolinate reductase [Propionibacteriaceae bacterium]
MTTVAVLGAKGRMGQEVIRAIQASGDLTLGATLDVGDPLEALVGHADVVVDFTHPDAVLDNLSFCVAHGLHFVAGTSGFDSAKLERVRTLLGSSPKANVIVAPNFSIGGLLMMHFAEVAAPFFESVEVIELHHPMKVDAPSGTAVNTAERIAAARANAGLGPVPDATTDDPDHARGATVEGIHVHAVRQRGLFANQQVLFGNEGEALTLTHNSFTRASYMPGVLAAVRAVGERPGLTVGIESLLGIG